MYFRTVFSFKSFTPPWFSSQMDCRLQGQSVFHSPLIMEDACLPRKKHIRSRSSPTVRMLQGLIASFHSREPLFSRTVINHLMRECSAVISPPPLPLSAGTQFPAIHSVPKHGTLPEHSDNNKTSQPDNSAAANSANCDCRLTRSGQPGNGKVEHQHRTPRKAPSIVQGFNQQPRQHLMHPNRCLKNNQAPIQRHRHL